MTAVAVVHIVIEQSRESADGACQLSMSSKLSEMVLSQAPCVMSYMICRIEYNCTPNDAIFVIGSVIMKRYIVTLDQTERSILTDITRKGSHSSQKVINALIILNCDEGRFNASQSTGETISGILQVSQRKVDRVKRRFVEEGLEIALGGRQGRREHYERKADGEFEARLVALSCSQPPKGQLAVVASAAGRQGGGVGVYRQRVS